MPRVFIPAIVVLAVLVRAAAILVLQSHTVARSTYEHGEIAANLLAGRGFSIDFLGAFGPTSQQAPVYPFLLACVYALFGIDTSASHLVMQLAQAFLGGVMVLGVMRLAGLFAPGRPLIPAMAGLMSALHPTLVYAATHIQVAGLAAAELVWLFVWAERAARSHRGGHMAALGLLLAFTVLTDPILILAAPALAWTLAQGGVSARKLARVALIAALGVTPWIARNAWVHGEFVFVKSTFGYAFWQGNCSLSEGSDKVVRPSVEHVLASADARDLSSWNRVLWAARHEAGYIDDIALTRAQKNALGRLSEPERSRVLMRRALDEIRTNPARYARLCLKRLWAFVFFDESNPKTRSIIYRVGHFGLTIWAFLGWMLMPMSLRQRVGPTLLTALLLMLFHAFTIVSARFHVPIEPLMAIWGAIGMVAFFGGYPRRLTVSNVSGSKVGLAANAPWCGDASNPAPRWAIRRLARNAPAITPARPTIDTQPHVMP